MIMWLTTMLPDCSDESVTWTEGRNFTAWSS